MQQDYDEAASLTVKLWNSLVKYQGTPRIGSSDLTIANDLVAEIKNATYASSVVLSLIPDTIAQLKQVMSDVDLQDNEMLIERLALVTGSTPRTPDWIREHGLCLENLVPGRSQIPHAGRGAIAQFAMRRGEIVVPAPTLQITNKDVLTLRNSETHAKGGTQLLLNYCFGHAKSSLLLCPQTNVILINHCSARNPKNCGDGPNAKLQWSSDWDDVSPTWLKLTIDELAGKIMRGISLEVVALRDIPLGEEVFIDYGPDWEAAWDTHVANWKPPHEDANYMSATKANDNIKDTLKQFASNKLVKYYEHPTMFVGCMYRISAQDSYKKWNTKTNWQEWREEDIMAKYAEDGRDHGGGYGTDAGHWPCSVIREEDGGETYTVRVWWSDRAEEQKWAENDLPRLFTNYPRSSMRLFHKQYHSDQHLPEAFRHPVGISDDIFPNHWKNRP